jgi:hypothetical protein
MSFSLVVVFEGSSGLGPVPICRVTDVNLTRGVTTFALERAKRCCDALRNVDDEAYAEANCEVERLQSVVAVV